MKPRQVLYEGETTDGSLLELAWEHEHYIIRVGGVPLMSSEMRGSEEAMAAVAREAWTGEGAEILVGGLGMGFTLRAALDRFGPSAKVCVAELLPIIVDFNRAHTGHLADHPLDDPRVTLLLGDVRECLGRARWDVILMDVDNGPDAFTTESNDALYGRRGVERLVGALRAGGVLVVWSAYQSSDFEERLRMTGLSSRTKRVRARWPLAKGPMHTLFVGTKG